MAKTPKELAQFLAKVPMFSTINMRSLEKLAKRLRERKYSDGEEIVEQGKVGIGLFFIESGTALVYREQKDSESVKIDTLGALDFFGELTLLDDAPRTATVVANGEVICYVLSKLDFLDELEDEPQIAIPMLKELATRFRRLVSVM